MRTEDATARDTRRRSPTMEPERNPNPTATRATGTDTKRRAKKPTPQQRKTSTGNARRFRTGTMGSTRAVTTATEARRGTGGSSETGTTTGMGGRTMEGTTIEMADAMTEEEK